MIVSSNKRAISKLHLWRLAGILTIGIVSVAVWSVIFQIVRA